MFVACQRRLLCLSVLLLSGSLATAQETPTKETAAEKIRKVLDQPITLNFSGEDLQDVANHLRTKTGVNFIIDPSAQFGLNQMPFPPGIGINGAPGGAPLEVKADNVKLQTVLQRVLDGQRLTHVILENSVVITTHELAVTRQMGQRINVRINEVPLQKALKEITRNTPVNLVLDPRVLKDAQNPVSLDLDGITVETAIRLLAELGGLKSVRVDNVLFVTNEARADKMRQEQPPVAQPNPNGPWPGVFGGGFGPGIGPGAAAVRPLPVPPQIPPAPPKN